MSLCKSRIPVREVPLGKPPEIPRIRLSLRKPKNWRISLTTSSSSAAIAIPDITISDDRGRILIDTSASKAPNRNPSSRKQQKRRESNIPMIIKSRSVDRSKGIAVENKKNRADFHKSSRGGPGGTYRGKSRVDKETSGGSRNRGDVGDSFPEVKEESAFPRGASELIRVKTTGTCKGINEPGTRARRSKRRFISSKQSVMGSNVSRQSDKGLSGRRSQSSGNLCNGAKIFGPSVNKLFNACGGGGVSNRDRNRFCGSLPNHLDDKEGKSGECSPEAGSFYNINNNYGDVYVHPEHDKSMEMLFLKVPPQHRHEFTGGDQGYASERSPEEEVPPPVAVTQLTEPPMRPHSSTGRKKYSFITKENTFDVRLEKNSRGFGISVTGGVDSEEELPGFIRIKRIFPNQPAWESKMLQIGDLILAANGVPLSGLTNGQALEVLRATPSEAVLSICRPPKDIFKMPLTYPSEPPPVPKRDPSHFISTSHLNVPRMSPVLEVIPEPYEFDIILNKVNGGLGFMLRKEEENVVGHSVRSLVREPAISDGRIRPGDKIVTVNGVDISPMTHEQAVTYMRQCGEEVKMRLYRDPTMTPPTIKSPTEPCETFKPRPALRKEAMDMLSDLAVKKKSPSDPCSSSCRSRLRGTTPSSSPRRRILKRTPSNERPERPGHLLFGTARRNTDYFEEEEEEEDETDSAATTRSTSEIKTILGATRIRQTGSDGVTEIFLEPTSMPLLASSAIFSYKNPAYQSAHATITVESEQAKERRSDQAIPEKVLAGGSQGLLKWKGVVFSPEEANKKKHSKPADDEEIVTLELTRGWNTRLGFSLQSRGNATCVSAVYANSVAAKDGRIRVGDEVIMINEETTEGMSTADMIDHLRRLRGSIEIVVKRKKKQKA